MRTLRLSLAGTVMLVLLGGLSGAVVAQDETRTLAQADGVTGTLVWSGGHGAETVSLVDGVQRTQDLGWQFRALASDPRVAGTFTMLGETRYEFPGPIVLAKGPVELVNADGRWFGEWQGGYERSMGSEMLGFLRGEGAYDGLTYLLHAEHDLYNTDFVDTQGVIYAGDIPGTTEEEPPAE